MPTSNARKPATSLSLRSRSETREGVATAACKERLPEHSILRGLVFALLAAEREAESHHERVPTSCKHALALLVKWCEGAGMERDLVAARTTLDEESQAYVRRWNEKMERAAERRRAGGEPQYPRSTFDKHLRDAMTNCLAMAPGFMPRREACAEGLIADVLKDAQATILVLGDDRTVASDRAAARIVVMAFRTGIGASPTVAPASLHVLLPPKTKAQIAFEEKRRRERFMGAFGGGDEDASTTLMGCPVPPPQDDEGRSSRVVDEVFDDMGTGRRYSADDIMPSEGGRVRSNPGRRR